MLHTFFQAKSLASRSSLLLMLCSVFFVFVANGQEQSDLKSIQQQIKTKQVQINQQLATAKTLQDNLKVIEIQIAKAARKLNKTQRFLDNNQQKLKILRKQQKDYLSSLAQQKIVLAKQIRSAYMTGNYDFAKMLLNQQDATNFERTITYYQYLNKARKLQIDSFNLLVKNLQEVNAKLINNQSELEQLKGKQLEQQQVLKANHINNPFACASGKSPNNCHRYEYFGVTGTLLSQVLSTHAGYVYVHGSKKKFVQRKLVVRSTVVLQKPRARATFFRETHVMY